MPEATASREPLDDLLGSVVAEKYRIDRLIGRGGMGAVFQATNLLIGKRVALKFLTRDAAHDRDATERFQREAHAASVVESAHIVHIFDSGTSAEGLPFLVMELLSGEDLRARLNRAGRLPVVTAASVAAQVLRALQRAHHAGIVHRDLKPDNVFLCQRDDGSLFVKIVDFGVSKLPRGNIASTLTGRGTVIGTAFYMSPEQAQAFPDIDGRTDLFSVGAMLYECLAGRPPHEAPTYESVLIAICTRDAEDVRQFAPEVSDALWSVMRRALERDRERRFASAEQMLEALLAAVPEAGITKLEDATDLADRRRSRVESAASFARTQLAAEPARLRRRMRTLTLSFVAVLTGFGITSWWVGQHRTPDTSAPLGARVVLATSLPTLEKQQASGGAPAGPNSVASSAPSSSTPGSQSPAPMQKDETRTPSAPLVSATSTASAKSRKPVETRTGAAPRATRADGQGKSGVVPGLELSTREP